MAGYDVVREPRPCGAVIGVTGQLSAVDDLLTGTENLRLMAALHHLGRREGRARTAALLDAVRPRPTRPQAGVQQWSGGMRRKLDLAMTLVG